MDPRVRLCVVALLVACNPSPIDTDDVDPATPGFPVYVLAPNAGAPNLDYQVCDSVTADLNLDGYPDFIAADHLEGGFGYFMVDPESLQLDEGRSVVFVEDDASAGVIAIDLNNDGRVDVVNSDHPGDLTVRINATPAGAGIDGVVFPDSGETDIDLGLDPNTAVGVAGVEGGMVGADFNGDGKIDFATANLGKIDDRYTSTVVLGTTADGAEVATFAAPQYLDLPSAAISIDLGDLNNDGKPDYVTTNTQGGDLSVFTNRTETGATTVDFERTDIAIDAQGNPHGAGPTNPVVADFNGDGWLDIASANWNVTSVSIFINTTTAAGAAPTFAAEYTVGDLGFNPLLVRAADLDADGDDDIVVIPLAMASKLAFAVIENETEDELAFADVQKVLLPTEMQSQDPYVWFTTAGNVADFDADGRLDIAVAVARGDFEMAAFELLPTNDVMAYVDAYGISPELVTLFLPRYTELVTYVQEQ